MVVVLRENMALREALGFRKIAQRRGGNADAEVVAMDGIGFLNGILKVACHCMLNSNFFNLYFKVFQF
jgi:hypothetical protein